MKKIILLTLIGLLLLILPAWAQINLLHEFAGGAADGAFPMWNLTLSGSTLYGMSRLGGDNNCGIIFKIQTDGSGYTILHEFSGGGNDGSNPYGGLVLSGSTLYGMTAYGGDNDWGTIFSISIYGTGFTLLYEFIGGMDGSVPEGSLVLSGSTLYGVTKNGGESGYGTVFKIQTNGTGYTQLHAFSGGGYDGASPRGSLALSGSTLYGVTYNGGDYDKGTIYKLQTDGNVFALLHEFAGGAADGMYPGESLIISDSTLYGMSIYGGDSNLGTIFKVTTSGSGFTLLHEFAGGAADGAYPWGDLILSGSTLFGMPIYGGDSNLGIVFKIETDGSSFSLLHEFAGGANDGSQPHGSLILSGSILYGTTSFGGDADKGVIFSLPLPNITVISPNGGESWTVGSNHDITWTSTGTVSSLNIDYSTTSGSSWTSVATGTANDGSYAWTIPDTPSTTCLVRVQEADGSPSDQGNAVFAIAAPVETVSAPTTPSGPTSGAMSSSYSYSTGGSTSSLGHSLQYKFDWDDGTTSSWLATGTTTESHSWAAAGTYYVRANARCAAHTAIESAWSTAHAMVIYDGDPSGAYNSPAQYKVLPEVIWAPATGGGTWMSVVQLTDVTGGSQVLVYYNTATGRRGPFLLWDNSDGVPLSSVKYANLLQTIDGLDTGTFTYYGTVGAVEFVTRDGNRKIHAAVREVNGNYSKTFSALSLHNANTATTGRAMIVSNLSSNATYRTTAGFFNPTADSITVEFTLLNNSGAQIGTPFNKTLAGHGFQAFNPFTEAGVPYPGSSYGNAILKVRPTTGAGKVMCFGATANNTSNDPASHLAVQNTTGYDNGPGSQQILPEVIWASASGGGTWMSEVQVTDVTGGSQVSVYYNTLSGRRGPFLLWNNSGGAALSSSKYANLLQTIDGLDAGTFTYYGTVGAVEFVTQDGSHLLQAALRELNGNFSKTFSGLNLVDAETADTARVMLIQNFTNNASYRSTSGFFNPTSDAVTLEFTLLNGSGAQIGTQFSKTLAGHGFQAFDPFTQAGVPYPGSSYDNVILRVRPTSGAGKVMCFGATANNTSNDPASHLAVQGQ